VPWAEFALLDWQDAAASVTFRRVSFDLEAVRQAALRSDMPHAEWWASEWSA
jgi:hypothetical protein